MNTAMTKRDQSVTTEEWRKAEERLNGLIQDHGEVIDYAVHDDRYALLIEFENHTDYFSYDLAFFYLVREAAQMRSKR